jgi:hypothetical protein
VGTCGIGCGAPGAIPHSGDCEARRMTLVWFIIWFVWNVVGDKEPIQWAPVNWWAGTLLLTVAIDLSKTHVLDRRG